MLAFAREFECHVSILNISQDSLKFVYIYIGSIFIDDLRRNLI